MKYFLVKLATIIFILPFLIVSCFLAIFIRIKGASIKPRLVWGPTPIINNKYWSQAMQEAGYQSTTLTFGYYHNINRREDFDELVNERLQMLPLYIKLPILFWESLLRFDVFTISFDGWLLGRTPLWRFEAFLMHLAGKKIIVIPYGSDAYVYKNVRSITLLHALMLSYPEKAREQDFLEKKVSYWTKRADCVNPAIMGIDGIGRWDVLRPSSLCIDTHRWRPSKRCSEENGTTGTVYIAHTPNHTGFKGTEYLVETVRKLKHEGLKVELLLIQNKQNEEVQEIFYNEADILVEQLNVTGHGISGVEGMASALPVIANLEDETYTLLFRRWSHLDECPILSACPENLFEQLRLLVTRPELRKVLGKAGREYVEKYYSFESFVYLFENKLKFVNGNVNSLLNLYHPIIGDYPKKLPYVKHPLINNKASN